MKYLSNHMNICHLVLLCSAPCGGVGELGVPEQRRVLLRAGRRGAALPHVVGHHVAPLPQDEDHEEDGERRIRRPRGGGGSILLVAVVGCGDDAAAVEKVRVRPFDAAQDTID